MIEFNLDFEEYKARPGVNASSFGAIDPDRDGCPAIWNARQEIKEDIEDTAALSFGRAFHKYCLEFEQFDDEYPPGSGGLEHDPKMRATYDAILEDK